MDNIDIANRTFDDVFSNENLWKSFKKCLNGVSWKGTVQNFSMHATTEIYKLMKQAKERRFKTGKFFRFDIMERGKLRHIRSVGINERVIQRCFCDEYLVPLLSKRFIYDNSACTKGKGMHFAIKRLVRYLRKAYDKYKTNDFYILQFDFRHYFDSIPHDRLCGMVCAEMNDENLKALYRQLVNDFEGDKGLGLGSQISQVSALFYPHAIDSRLSSMEGVLGYARYMDDGYVIAKDKETLEKALLILTEMVSGLCLEMHWEKTKIHKVSHRFEFLKTRVCLHQNGRITVKPNRKNITRNRQKLRKLVQMAKRGILTMEYVANIFKTTLSNLRFFNAYHTSANYAKLYAELTGEKHGIRLWNHIQQKSLVRQY